MKVIVTGGLGQIGSHVTEMLLERGDDVLVIDNLATGRKEHLNPHEKLTIKLGTISDLQFMDETFSSFKAPVEETIVFSSISIPGNDIGKEPVAITVFSA